jgi:hypothetical protein
MKRTIIGLAIIFISVAGFAQDIITKKSGEEIPAILKEITPKEIKYKRFTNPDGPLYTLLKSDVLMIRYQNGEIEKFEDAPQITAPARPEPPTTQHPAQPAEPPAVQPIRLAGPRIGATFIGPGEARDNLQNRLGAQPFITQFGWQFETRFFTLSDGSTGVFEFIPLVGGLEQGLFLPSASALVGFRGPEGLEFGFGPNLSLAGPGVVFALGVNFKSQEINFPVNFAVVASPSGARISLLIGFNVRN